MDSLREAMHAEAAGVPLLGDIDRAIHDVSVVRRLWAGAFGVAAAVVLVVALVGPGWQPLAVQPATPQPSPTTTPQGGAVIAWGSNEGGQTFVPSDAQSGVTAVSAGRWHAMALKGGRVITWGGGRMADLRTSVPVAAQSGVTAIAAGGFNSLALRDGQVIAWGENGDFFEESVARLRSLSGVTAIAAFGADWLALADGRVIGPDNNGSGRTTVPVEAQSGVSAIAAGEVGSLALKDGRVIAWNSDGSARPPSRSRPSPG